MRLLNHTADGYHGIWYMNQPVEGEYRYKYSGGLGTYCAKHSPFAVHCPEVSRTFFCFGGTTPDYHRRSDDGPLSGATGEVSGALLHTVGYYDHETGKLSQPTVLLDKGTGDAHDNPVISVDDEGFIWVFSTAHGISRPSAVHRSVRRFCIDRFEGVDVTRREEGRAVPFDNFSYMQVRHVPERGFSAFMTRYGEPAQRTIGFISSSDGVSWSEWQPLAAIARGHYQISEISAGVAGTAFNYHPSEVGLNARTNLYYVETRDGGGNWRTADGRPLSPPLTEKTNPALVHDYEAEGRLVYLKDMRLDAAGRPIILHLVSSGYEPGPENGPRVWRTARWDGSEWVLRDVTESDSNYDMGSLYVEGDGSWRIIAPTETGPQPYNPGGEMVLWESADEGQSWRRLRAITEDSPRNHTYARRPVNAHPDFYALWADGHARRPSPSRLHLCDREGNVRTMPAGGL